ncbi:MAG: SH3 domain-containing protein [Anaerolineaceae bacterium]|nr:SH3 domain-containing protein [Anaerolineaceae bacterium]
MVILMVVMGAVFGLLFLLNSIRRAIQGSEKVSFFETLLAFLAVVFPVLALVNNSASTQPLRLVNMAAIGLGVIVVVVSIITFLIERRHSGRKLSQRRGVLGFGLGLLIVAATFIVPVISRLQMPTRAALNVASAPADGSNINVSAVGAGNAVANNPTATLEKPIAVVPSNTPDVAMLQMSATPTRFLSPMPTATNTPFVIATTTAGTVETEGTIQPTEQAAAQGARCIAVVRQNVNLRSGPATTYDLLLTIPFSTTLDVSAKNKAGDWWFVRYQDKTGWVSGEYVNADANCASLPVKAAE